MTYTIEQARLDIAAAHRIGARMGFNEGFNGGHFTLMAPGSRDRVLTIANGTHWEEVRPTNVIIIDMSGNTVEGTGQVERSAFPGRVPGVDQGHPANRTIHLHYKTGKTGIFPKPVLLQILCSDLNGIGFPFKMGKFFDQVEDRCHV